MTKIKNVLVVSKLHTRDLRPQSRTIHKKTLAKVLQFLKEKKISYCLVDRKNLAAPLRADLIITVGGDGTVLAASHHAGKIPIVAINSAPSTSTGFFCLASPTNFPRHLEAILNGKIKPIRVPRLVALLNGKPVKPFGLNDLLFASSLPGETARYKIRVGRREEEQKSSGVWVATGAGSTGAIYSAGGKRDLITSRRLQYFVREPLRFPKNHYRLRNASIRPGSGIIIHSQMFSGMIFIDGARWRYRVPKNGRLEIRGGQSPLLLFR